MAGNTYDLTGGAVDYSPLQQYGSGADGTSVAPITDAANGLGSDMSFTVPKTPDTVSQTAVQAMAPVTAPNSVDTSGWSRFWQDTLGGVIKTGAQVAAVKNGVVAGNGQPGANMALTRQQIQQPKQNGLAVLLLIGLGVLLVVEHKG